MNFCFLTNCSNIKYNKCNENNNKNFNDFKILSLLKEYHH